MSKLTKKLEKLVSDIDNQIIETVIDFMHDKEPNERMKFYKQLKEKIEIEFRYTN